MGEKKQIFIVFCGADGVGKTTLAKKLVEKLRKEGVGVSFIHGHGYAVSESSFGFREKTARRFAWLFCLFIPLAFIDSVFTYYFKYRPVFKKRVLVCDRYFYDKLARMMFYGIANFFIGKVYLKFLPKPDLAFFLDLSAEEIYKRKKEYCLTELDCFREIYKFICKNVEGIKIDTQEDINKSFKKIFLHIEKK